MNEVLSSTNSNTSNIILRTNDIATINSTIGSASLTTTNQTLKGAINEVKSTTSTSITNLDNTLTGIIGTGDLNTNANTIKTAINENVTNIANNTSSIGSGKSSDKGRQINSSILFFGGGSSAADLWKWKVASTDDKKPDLWPFSSSAGRSISN